MIFASGLSQPEGPVVLPDGDWLVVEMGLERGCVSRLSADGKSRRQILHTGRPNGLAMDASGHFFVCESLDPALICMTVDGEVLWRLGDGVNRPFLWPNDIAIGPDGMLYMTDSGVHQPDWYARRETNPDNPPQGDMDGRVFRIDPATRDYELLDSGLRFANGIAFDRDNLLYVTETLTGEVSRYERSADGSLVKMPFANVWDPAKSGYRGPDGMAFGLDGNLYVAVAHQGDVAVLKPDGQLIQRISTQGKRPTNVCFGPNGERSIYVTEAELGNVEVFEVDTAGLPLNT